MLATHKTNLITARACKKTAVLACSRMLTDHSIPLVCIFLVSEEMDVDSRSLVNGDVREKGISKERAEHKNRKELGSR